MTTITFRAERGPLGALITGRARDGLSASLVAKRDLGRYYAVLANSGGEVQEAIGGERQAHLVLDALKTGLQAGSTWGSQKLLTFDTTPLAAARRRLGLSQEAVAEAAGVSVRTVQHVESGDHKPRVDNLAAIAGVLGVNPALLFVHAPEVAKTSWLGDDLSLGMAWAEVADHIELNDAAAVWGITDDEANSLVTRLRTLSPGGRARLLDAVESWWHLDEDQDDAEARLRVVGLIA